jgi:hypothetical protein
VSCSLISICCLKLTVWTLIEIELSRRTRTVWVQTGSTTNNSAVLDIEGIHKFSLFGLLNRHVQSTAWRRLGVQEQRTRCKHNLPRGSVSLDDWTARVTAVKLGTLILIPCRDLRDLCAIKILTSLGQGHHRRQQLRKELENVSCTVANAKTECQVASLRANPASPRWREPPT